MATSLPIVKVVPPVSLRGQSNGQLGIELLEEIAPRFNLHFQAARAWRALAARAALDKVPLLYTVGGMYRTYGSQVVLFTSRYTTTVLPGRPTKRWQGQTWYQAPNTAMAAVPGTSNHGWGLAIDTALGTKPSSATGIGPQINWLGNWAPQFGFSWETLPSEPWHIRYVAGDAIPAAVLAYEDALRGIADSGLNPAERDPHGGTVIRILRSIQDSPEFYAQFIAVCDAEGRSIEVQWSGSGDDPKVVKRMSDLRESGIKDQHITLAGLRNNRLHPKHAASQIQDARRAWVDDDFAA